MFVVESMVVFNGMKLLNGKDLAEFIKERQAHQVRGLRQAAQVAPKLAIIVTVDNPVIEVYMRAKQKYGEDIEVDVEIHRISQEEIAKNLQSLNSDPSVHGIIIQLPLQDPSQTQELCDLVAPEKDVDGLGVQPAFDPATPLAIQWLLAGYNIELRGKKILILGRGKLVGAPLSKIYNEMELDVESADSSTKNLTELALDSDIIVTATGSPAVLKPEMLKQGAVVVDAGVASEEGKTVGDLDPAVYERDDLTITPAKGGVGPLTISALFDNVIRAARMQANEG